MDSETKEKILANTEQFLDDVDDVMTKIQEKYHSFKTKTREAAKPQVENLEKVQSDLKLEYAKLKLAGEQTSEAANKKFNDYADRFAQAYEDLVNTKDEDNSDTIDWSDVPPPSIQIGHPNPAAAVPPEDQHAKN